MLIFTWALRSDDFLLWQQDASPVGTDGFSGPSTDTAALMFHPHLLSPGQEVVQDSALALPLSHLESEGMIF